MFAKYDFRFYKDSDMYKFVNFTVKGVDHQLCDAMIDYFSEKCQKYHGLKLNIVLTIVMRTNHWEYHKDCNHYISRKSLGILN